jgi:hypothetical protein
MKKKKLFIAVFSVASDIFTQKVLPLRAEYKTNSPVPVVAEVLASAKRIFPSGKMVSLISGRTKSGCNKDTVKQK